MIKTILVLALAMGITACRCANATEDGMSTKSSETVPANCVMREFQGMTNACHRKEWT